MRCFAMLAAASASAVRLAAPVTMMANPPSPFAYSAPKASPLALRALRDLAIVSEQLREMQDAVRRSGIWHGFV